MALVDEERELLLGTTREVLIRTPPAHVLTALGDLGWFDLRRNDRPAAEGLLFELQGELLTTSGALDAVLTEGLGAASARAGDVAVALPIPGRQALAGKVGPGGRLQVDGILAGPPSRDVVVALSADVVVTLPVTALEVRPLTAIDPWSGWRRVRGAVDGGVRQAGEWSVALAAGRRAVAHELVGIARGALAMAVDHVTERRQFGRPVGSFQAVQHRLADVRVAVAAAELAVEAAWEDDGPLVAMLAKILAGLAVRTASRHCQQACGGMGFTWEHRLHRYVRRGIALDHLLGSASELQRELGQLIGGTGAIPRLAHL